MKEDFQAVLDYAGHGKRIRCLPAGLIVAMLKFLEFLRLSPLYKWVYETAGQESFVAIEKAQKVLGFSPRYSNRDALIRNYQWYLDHLEEFGQASGISHRVPWKQGILRVAKWFF
jgi:nucleoside-diphosphate-sugar epimerase